LGGVEKAVIKQSIPDKYSRFYALFALLRPFTPFSALFRPPPKMMEIIAAVCNSMSIFLRRVSIKARKSKSKVEKKVKIINEIDLS
jgi:hypothetical protein